MSTALGYSFDAVAVQGRRPLKLDSNNIGLLLFATAWGATIPMVGRASFGDVDSGWTAVIAFLLGATGFTLLLFNRPGAQLSLPWRTLWTASLVAFLVQLRWQGEPGDFGLSDILLATLWLAGVAVAWTSPATSSRAPIIWPQSILLFVLAGSALDNLFAQHATTASKTLGAVLVLAIVAGVWWRARTLYKLVKKAQANPLGSRPQPPNVDLGLILLQVKRDAWGKEVQSAATYSYVWFADQVGHVGLGMVLGFALTGLFCVLFGKGVVLPEILGFGAAGVSVCVWEFLAYRAAIEGDDSPFPPGKTLIRKNAEIAATYMLLGVLLGCAFLLHRPYQVPMLVAATFVGVVSAKYWVRQKIIWQKAGLPYLFRLAESQHEIEPDQAKALRKLIQEAAPPDARARQVVVAGPVNSGRTMLASGIGTEFAFQNKRVRYLSLDRLLEFAAGRPPNFYDDPGPANVDYWPWTETQVLVIDDVGPFVRDDTLATFSAILKKDLAPVRDNLCVCHTIWILGDVSAGPEGKRRLGEFAHEIRGFCKGQYDPVTIPLMNREISPPV